jgi:hypothetical protein
MTTIKIRTRIKAPIQTVFDVSRDIDIHQQSAKVLQMKPLSTE